MSEIIERLRKHYTGRQRNEVVNPCITAREAIEIANHISALEQPCNCDLVVSLRKTIDDLRAELLEFAEEPPEHLEDWPFCECGNPFLGKTYTLPDGDGPVCADCYAAEAL